MRHLPDAPLTQLSVCVLADLTTYKIPFSRLIFHKLFATSSAPFVALTFCGCCSLQFCPVFLLPIIEQSRHSTPGQTNLYHMDFFLIRKIVFRYVPNHFSSYIHVNDQTKSEKTKLILQTNWFLSSVKLYRERLCF